MAKIQQFFNSAIGSWTKVFISAVLLQWLNMLMEGRGLFTWDMSMLEKILTAGAVALFPVIINFLNPADPRYGTKTN